jgi:hypothetical protein
MREIVHFGQIDAYRIVKQSLNICSLYPPYWYIWNSVHWTHQYEGAK